MSRGIQVLSAYLSGFRFQANPSFRKNSLPGYRVTADFPEARF
jgi:hypothetical protein